MQILISCRLFHSLFRKIVILSSLKNRKPFTTHQCLGFFIQKLEKTGKWFLLLSFFSSLDSVWNPSIYGYRNILWSHFCMSWALYETFYCRTWRGRDRNLLPPNQWDSRCSLHFCWNHLSYTGSLSFVLYLLRRQRKTRL